MPGNEVGDRAHSFLVQENLYRGGNWPSDSGLRVNNQKQFGFPGSFTKAYGPQQSGVEPRHMSQTFHVPNGYNIMQTNERLEFANYQSQIQHQNLNGYVYGHHDLQTRPDETQRLGLDTESDQDNMNQRGFLLTDQTSKSHRSNEYGVNLFGGQHTGLLQPVQQQQSGFGDIQHVQQQLMLKRMQELQRQKSMHRVDSTQHNVVNQVSPFARQPSETRLHELVKPIHTGFPHQQFDQSLYGSPVSSSMGQVNPYSLQVPSYDNSVTDNQYHTHVQGSNSWMNVEQIQQMKPAHQSSSDQLFQGSQDEPEMASLDPEEKKILFGSDDNIWDAFGSDRPSELLDDNEFASGFSSIQSGTWSALMQSAVAETNTSSGVGLQDELTGLTFQNPQHSSQQFQCYDTATRVMHEEIGHSDGVRRVNTHPNSNVDLGPTSTSMGSPQFNDGHIVRNAATAPSLSYMQGGSNRFDQLPSNSHHQLSYWKHVEASVKSQHHLNHVSESSFNSSDKEDVKMHEIENSNDSYQSTSSRHLIPDAAGDPRVQSGRLTSGQQRMFQCHPMGNVNAKFGGQVPKVGHEVDQSRDGGIAKNFNSSEHNISAETHETDYSDGIQRSQSSNSQGFGLHLGPQRLRDSGSNSLNRPYITQVDQGQMTNEPLRKESVIDVLPMNSTTTRQIDLEAFGRSLKTLQNISVTNQTSDSKNLDYDPYNRVTKRLKHSDSFLDGRNESQTSVSGNKVERSHISPQMAPSWFAKYGTFGNDELTETVNKVKSVDHPFNIVERLSGGLKPRGQVSSVDDISKNLVPPLMAFEQTSLLPMDAAIQIQNLVTLTPNKQISTAVDLCPWLVELSGTSKNLKGICSGAVEWSRASNRLMEKVDDDGSVIIDDVLLPIAKPKRRLIVNSLLMQQLFRPPPTAILLLDTCRNYESLVYYAARLALGDACNLVSSATSHPNIPLAGTNCVSDKSDDHHLSKVMENFTSKARKLEEDFMRVDNRGSSILDLRVEVEEIERFSIFNRFARFHGRGQSDVARPSSSDAPAPAPVSKSFHQRYVTAVRLPPNLPDRVQCLSL